MFSKFRQRLRDRRAKHDAKLAKKATRGMSERAARGAHGREGSAADGNH